MRDPTEQREIDVVAAARIEHERAACRSQLDGKIVCSESDRAADVRGVCGETEPSHRRKTGRKTGGSDDVPFAHVLEAPCLLTVVAGAWPTSRCARLLCSTFERESTTN